MHVDKSLIGKLSRAANLTNTLNGGMSQAIMNVKFQDNEWLIHLKIPGVEVNNIKLEIMDGHLFIYQLMHMHEVGLEETPFLISMLPLIANIDINAITASFSSGYTSIVLPVNQQDSGNEREIDIVRI